MRQRLRIDPELGLVRYCTGCADWLPDDAEFWYVSNRAGTSYQRNGRTHRRLHDAMACRACATQRPYESPVPCPICLSVRTTRFACHGCAGRIVGPMTATRLAEYGLASTA